MPTVDEERMSNKVTWKEDVMTNKEYAKTDSLFEKCCELAGIKPTRRQASKFLNGKGIARKYLNLAEIVEEEKEGVE